MTLVTIPESGYLGGMKDGLSPVEEKGLNAFKERVLKEFGGRVGLCKIFGSRARSEGWAESDIDVLVLIEGLTWREKARIIDLSSDVNLECDLMISPLVMKPEEFSQLLKRERRLALDIEREGVPL